MTFFGFRRKIAISSASRTSSVRRWFAIAQPTMRRLYTSSTTAKYRNPLHVGTYMSISFGSRCREAGIRPSMGSVGDCYDNAMCESWNATLECELLVKRRFKNQREASIAIFDFIEGWYNPRRRH